MPHSLKIHYLHGNLQQPSVWLPFAQSFSTSLSQFDSVEFNLVSLWQSLEQGFWRWAEEFNSQVRVNTNEQAQVLLGYSQGGRLALHALLSDPTLWSAAIVIGAHPGLIDRSQCQARLSSDQHWAKRFATEPWEQLMTEWDSQPIFSGWPNLSPRQESEFSRDLIARVFENFSLGLQDDLRPLLKKTEIPAMLFINGQQDKRFATIGKELTELNPSIVQQQIPDACHRVPWENPDEFTKASIEFLDSLF